MESPQGLSSNRYFASTNSQRPKTALKGNEGFSFLKNERSVSINI